MPHAFRAPLPPVPKLNDCSTITLDASSRHESLRDSEALLLFLSASLLTRPWALLEMLIAIASDVPIIAINAPLSRSYDHEDAMVLLTHLDTELELRNPGASKLLLDHGVDLCDAAFRLSTVMPSIISVDFNPSQSRSNILASVLAVVDQINIAQPQSAAIPYDPDAQAKWLAARGPPPF